jgi:hypothetical protein
MYDYYLGGSQDFAADRQAAAKALCVQADVRRPEQVLEAPLTQRLIDFDQPDRAAFRQVGTRGTA